LNQVLPQLSELFCASSDAGDYLCNYMYYKSLVALNKVADVIFIHVPTFDVIPETVQLEGLNLLVSLL
jgi:pyrrolidone-carboxylate peptidase